MACLGPFCGYFRDELEADSDSEEEDDENKASSKMTGSKPAKVKKRRWRRRPKPQDDPSGRGGGSAKMRWAQYLSQVSVRIKARGGMEMVQQVSELRADGATNLTHGMMKCISQLPKLHAIEIIRCHVEEVPPLLSDCESLVILRMSHNRLRTFSDDFARCTQLEQIILDWNDIGEIGAGIFGTRGFNHLEVINMSHNALSALPSDFGITAKATMRQIDLSNNRIQVIPDSILKCTNLEELDLSHNQLKRLPGNFKLTKLQRLYVSFNELTCLPEDIGRCESLTKIRIISNHIKELPDSIIDLWPKKPGGRVGKLEQFLVERNPLVMPSITAFEMDNGGIDRAFQLLYEHVAEKRVAEQKAAETAKALEDQKQAAAAAASLAIEDRINTVSADSGMLETILEGNTTPRSSKSGASGTSAIKHQDQQGTDYYFAHCQGDAAKIAEIRDAESTLLLIKKNMFLQAQRKLAEEVRDSDDVVPDNLKIFLEPDCFDTFKGVVPVRDLDLYFNLLVFSMKAQFPTCQQLFIKYEDGDKGYLTREEWNEFCLCVPIHINDMIRDQMWQLIAFRRSEHDRVTLNDFVAAWQIHDIEMQDPFITSMTKVLQLDYYDMSVRELRQRVAAQGARDATPQLDFDSALIVPNLRVHAPGLQDSEGLHALDDRLREAAERSEKLAQKRAQTSLSARKATNKNNIVSLTDSQYQQGPADTEEGEGGQGEGQKKQKAEEEVLSDDSDSEEEEFDAQATLRQQDLSRLATGAKGPDGKIAIDSDEAIRKLMELPPDQFFVRHTDLNDTEKSGAADKKAGADPEKEEEKKAAQSKHDIFMVRKELRKVYRNMPHNDFVSLINYLLRALQMIKHVGGHIYWHADDPSFKFVLGEKGTNAYTRSLLSQLGFQKLSEVHWVWPNPIFDTPHRVISKEVDKNRLDNMIVLLKSCQMSLYKTGTNFTGNFTLLRC